MARPSEDGEQRGKKDPLLERVLKEWTFVFKAKALGSRVPYANYLTIKIAWNRQIIRINLSISAKIFKIDERLDAGRHGSTETLKKPRHFTWRGSSDTRQWGVRLRDADQGSIFNLRDVASFLRRWLN